jgi:hypothetical protein
MIAIHIPKKAITKHLDGEKHLNLITKTNDNL